MRFADYLELKGIEPAEAARQLGYPYRTVRNWILRLRKQPRPDALAKIKAWSGGMITADDFIDNSPAPQPSLKALALANREARA